MAGLPPWARVSPERRAHMDRVATLLDTWATRLAVPPGERERWLRAAYLHDALRDADPQLLAELTPDPWGIPALWHGPAAAAAAEGDGENDRGIVDAVRYHSVGYAGWDDVGRMLYLADYLDPGRSFQRGERAALAGRVPQDRWEVLREVARRRLTWLLTADSPLLKETADFWNALSPSPPPAR